VDGSCLARIAFILPLLLSPVHGIAGAAGTPSGAQHPVRWVKDEVGRDVLIPAVPRRIVSMAPSVTETLSALGAGDRVVGVTDFCDYPVGSRGIQRIGGMVNPNWEVILSLHADLLLATTAGNDRSVVARADSLHLPLFFLDTPDLASLLESLTRLGDVLGLPARAFALRRDLTLRMDRLAARIPAGPHPTVVFVVWGDPLVVPGRRTFLDDALRRAGCDSVTSDGPPGWPTYDLEAVLARNPGWVLATTQNAGFLKSLKERPGWRVLDAVARGRVAAVDPALERPAPRVVDAMEALANLLAGPKK
jgi:cobalamin transport system substrate-binding protein